MNFVQAVLGRLSRSGIARAIQSQAETELGRPLNDDEIHFLFSRSTPKTVLEQIQKVTKLKNVSLKKSYNIITFSLDMVISSSSSF